MVPLLEVSTVKIDGDGRLSGAEEAAETLRRAIFGGSVVLLRGLISAERAEQIRKHAFEQMATSAARPPEGLSGRFGEGPNQTRIEVVPEQEGSSARAFRTRLGFSWNPSPAGDVPASMALARLRNVIADRPRDFGASDPSAFTVSQVVHYPRGGGFLARHFDHDDGLVCVIIVALTQPGRDFRKGGLFVEPMGVRLDIEPWMRPGDACLFRPELYHGVDPIDPMETGPDFGSDAGRWVLNPMLRSTGGIALSSYSNSLPPSLVPPEPVALRSEPVAAPKVASAPQGAPAPDSAPAPDATFQAWCELLGLRAPKMRLLGALVSAIDHEAVSFLVPGSASPLRVSCRAPGSGPVLRASLRFGVYYFADGRARLSPSEERFLTYLCELTVRRDAEGRA